MTLNNDVRELLQRCVTARVCSTNGDGGPHAAPFWMSFDGTRIYLDTLENATVRNLRRDPRVAVLVDEGTRFEDLRGTLVRGVARLWTEEEAPEHVRQGIEMLRATHKEETSTAVFDAYLAQETRDIVLVEITAEKASYWNLAESARRAQ